MSQGYLPDHTKLTAWIHDSKFGVEVFGTGYSVAETGEQFAWLSAALRSSPYTLGVACCTPSIGVISLLILLFIQYATTRHQIFCKIDFTIQECGERFEPSNGQCWHKMFRNPIVVQGYPISSRSEPSTGLEIPLDIMAGLARTRRINTFNGKLFIKGFSTMLVPTRHSGDLLIWHLLYNKNGSRISYLDNTVASPGNANAFDLETTRHIVGWCSEVKYYAGRNHIGMMERPLLLTLSVPQGLQMLLILWKLPGFQGLTKGAFLRKFLYARDQSLGVTPDSPLAIKIHQFIYCDKTITYQNSCGSLRSL